MSEEAATYEVCPSRTPEESLHLLRIGLEEAPFSRLPPGPWRADQIIAGPAYTWHVADARGTTLMIVAGPLGDRLGTAAVAQAVCAVPVLIGALRAVAEQLDEAFDRGHLIQPQERALYEQVRGALAFAGAVPQTGGEAPGA